MDYKQTKSREAEVGQWSAAPEPGQNENELGGRSSWGTRKVCELRLGQGVCTVLGCLEGLTRQQWLLCLPTTLPLLFSFRPSD